MQVVMFPYRWDTDPETMSCMLTLFQDKHAGGNKACKSPSPLLPALQKSDPRAIPSFSVENMKYSSCLSRQRLVGELTSFTEVLNTIHRPSANNYSVLSKPQADVWCIVRKGTAIKIAL